MTTLKKLMCKAHLKTALFTIALCLTINQTYAQSFTINAECVQKLGGYGVSCQNGADGHLRFSIVGGTLGSTYTALWSNGATTSEIFNASAGTYSLIVTGPGGATAYDTLVVTEPSSIGYQLSLSDHYGYNCSKYGVSDAEAQLSGTGGTPPYRYLWADSSTQAHRDHLAAGSYGFIIKDANNCSVSNSATITQPDPVNISITNIQAVSCFGNEDGGATISITGGLGDFSVDWDNGSVSTHPNDLPAGQRTVSIYERGRRITTDTVEIASPDEINIAMVISAFPNGFAVSCPECANGGASATVSGGTAPYAYQWNDFNNSTTAQVSNLGPDSYTLTVTDAHGCAIEANAKVTGPAPNTWNKDGNALSGGSTPAEFIGTTDSTDVVFKSSNIEALRIKSASGNVEIIQGMKIDSLAFIPDSAESSERLLVTDQNGNVKSLKGKFHSGCNNYMAWGQAYTWTENPDGTQNYSFTNSDDIIKCPILGNVGIGLTNPHYKLDVEGTGRFGNNLFVNEKIGIGTTLPNEKLHILNNGNGGAAMLLEDNSSTPGKLWLQAASDAGRIISDGSLGIFIDKDNNNSSAYFSILKNSSWYGGGVVQLFKVSNAGDGYFKESLSIGTASINQDYRLMVCGKIRAKAMRVDEGWCDYVFEDDYKLLPLNEVEKYYQKNKHLPEIPSASEIESEGLDLGKIVALQMKKIEELTLHLVEMEKQIIELKNKK